MRSRIGIVCAVLSLGAAAPAAAAPTFSAPTPFNAGPLPSTIAAADFDLDGKPDLVTANESSAGSNGITALRNTTAAGTTTPSFGAATPFATGPQPRVVTVLDVNADGLPDLATANEISDDGGLSVLMNANVAGSNTITFSAPTGIGGPATTSVASADVNADGKPDIVSVAPSGPQPVDVFLNITTAGSPTPSFRPPDSFGAGTSSLSVATPDVNRDGRPDIVVANAGSGAEGATVLLNTTRAGATASSFAGPFPIETPAAPTFVTATDANGDGKPDLAIAQSSGGGASLLLNATPAAASRPTFSAPIALPGGESPAAVTSTDVNGDGKADLVVVDIGAATQGASQVLLNTTEPGEELPSFSGPTAFEAGSRPVSVAAADLNADGRPDLAAANSNTDGPGGNTINLNTTPPALTVAPASLAFGFQPLATISAPRTITLDNSTDATLPVRVLESGNAEDFLISRNDCGGGVPAGGSCDVSIRFAPGVKGVRQATLTLDPAGPRIEHVALSGDGGELPQGPPGSKGDSGAKGDTGATGVTGSPGATGPPGRDAKVTCKVAKRKKSAKKLKVTCRVRLVKPASAASWRLTRHGRTRAKGTVRGRAATLHLPRLAPGRYVLRIGGRSAATIRVTRR